MTALTQRPTVGIVGLGIMGTSYARNLLKAGFAVVGTDVDPGAKARLEEAGGTARASAAEVVAAGDVVLLVLPSADALRAVTDEIVPHLRPGMILCEMGTLPVEAKEAARERIDASGAVLLDCPVSGTGAQAAEADIVVFASGDPTACERMQPAFAAIARKVTQVGPFGAGMKLKCVANLLVTVHNLATAEALMLARQAGLDLDMVLDTIRAGAGNLRIFELRGPLMVREAYEPATMKLDVYMKDLAIIGAFAASVGAPTPLLDACQPYYDKAIEEGRGRQDTAALYEVLRGMAERP